MNPTPLQFKTFAEAQAAHPKMWYAPCMTEQQVLNAINLMYLQRYEQLFPGYCTHENDMVNANYIICSGPEPK